MEATKAAAVPTPMRASLRPELLEALKAAVMSDVRLTLTAIAAIAGCSVATVPAVHRVLHEAAEAAEAEEAEEAVALAPFSTPWLAQTA